jgi:hypothetical protein
MGYALSIGLVLLLGAAVPMLRPIDAPGYQDRAVAAAEGGLSAVRTTALLARTTARGKAFGPYGAVVLGDAREAVATAQHELATVRVPDPESARLRDELSPLLAESSAAVGDAGLVLGGGDRGAIDAAAARLDGIGDRLESFVEGHR